MSDSEKSIGEDTRFAVTPGLEITQVPDGIMIFQADRDRVHYLNPTAAIVLELCTMGKSRAEIETFISDGFALPATPSDDVESCLSSLLDEGLVVRT
jgi:hypothetical protein